MNSQSAAGLLFYSRVLALLMVFAIMHSGCSDSQDESRPPLTFREEIIQERLAKDQTFKSADTSPLLERDRAAFRGLHYYPVNPDLRFALNLNRYPAPKQMKLATNTGEIRRGLRYGYFDFQVENQACRLNVYRLEDASGSGASLFMPFRDSTSGKETYAAGRYMDLDENTSGMYDLDFNRAYNPYCVYNSEYSCPVPPAENTLTVPIRAGERIFPTAEH
ncbi:MAG: DUF1684 domain-containing protein [Acidobacteria bacterium]|nr:DUF1684 domain-containing protein [Acidobacteriota bacterium]